jgi:mannose-1-phosphate guanylyltransferase/mannose-6-phosphate isomerase
VYVVILAGGGGTRLWPLSRRDRPKPFLPLVGERTLFQRTVARIGRVVGPDDVYVVAERRHVPLVREQAPQLPHDHVLAEPQGRNTAAAIALATLAIERPVGEVMLVLPADAWITDEAEFAGVIDKATEAGGLAQGALGVDAPLVTLGVQTDPHRPETGYGYLVPEVATGETVDTLRAYRLQAFIEKPGTARAAELVRTPGVAWNAGMFAWRRRAILAALEEFAPDVLDGVRLALSAPGAPGEGGADWPLAGDEAARRYVGVRAISIDYAVMEPAAARGIVLMGAMDVGWSDVGSWSAVRDLARTAGGADAAAGAGVGPDGDDGQAGEDGGGGEPEARPPAPIDVDSRRTYVRSAGGRLVVTIGLSDTIVVDTPDALLVCAADRAQDVKAIVERLGETGGTEYL